MSDDYRDIAARHHIDCVCAACERAQYEEKLQHLAAERRETFAEAVFDPKLWFATQYGYIADTDPIAWGELVAWLVANPCDSEQSRATKLIAAFVMRRKA